MAKFKVNRGQTHTQWYGGRSQTISEGQEFDADPESVAFAIKAGSVSPSDAPEPEEPEEPLELEEPPLTVIEPEDEEESPIEE